MISHEIGTLCVIYIHFSKFDTTLYQCLNAIWDDSKTMVVEVTVLYMIFGRICEREQAL